MQHLSTSVTRRENSRPHCLFLQTVALCVISFLISVAEAQNNSSCNADQQPVITAVNPPSGTVETIYRINGENLNETRSILAVADDNGDVLNMAIPTANGYNIMLGMNAADSRVTIIFVPTQDSCLNATVELSILREISIDLIDDPLVVQPGTIAATRTSCLPFNCGDNSTDYEVIVNGHQLQKIDANRLGFVVRFPDTNVTFPPSLFLIQTFYSLLNGTDDRVMFRESPPITSISPTMGQRGTRVVIEGENLEGYGEGTKDITRVVIGGSPANITFSNLTHVFARLNSGTPNSTSIGINTTQTISRLDPDFINDGPYTYSDDLWTQLEDGVVTELLPPAAQIGTLLTICGERLLGGGIIVTGMSIAGQNVLTFGEVGPNQNPGGPPECINATVPDIPNPQGRVRGSIIIEANTGALVESQNNIAFTYANITSVNPSQGQVGTEVTISGIELLSGYSDLEPTVYLSDVEATVLNASDDTVIVRVDDPGPSGSGNFLSLNTTGDVVVAVTQNGQDYTVSMSDSWTYLEAGIIEQVEPGFGQFGTRINITGTNLLGYGSTLSQALIGNATATIISYSDTVVVLDAPDISGLGFVDIVLVSDNGARVSRDQAFEYRERGIITGLNPSSGQIGTIVVISGSNLFGHAGNVSQVTFGVVEAEIDYTQATDTSITVRIQSNDVTSDTAVSVVIIGSTMARVSSSDNIWTYLVPGSIGNVQPNIGQNGTMVNITGINLLGGGNSVASIFLDGVPAAVNMATSTLITVTMDDLSNQIGSYRDTVRIVANTGAIITGGTYNHRASGVITNIDPRMGREGTRITITGNNLSGYGQRVDRVLIAGVEAIIINQTSGSVVVGVGAASAGTRGTVVLISNTGAFVSSADSLVFNYTEQGIISNVSPSEGAEGSGILIEGVSLRPVGTVIIEVMIGGSPVSRIVTESESEVSVIAGPAPETGDYNMPIIITASDGSIVRGGNFSYLNLTLSLPDIDQGQLGTEVRINLPNVDAFIASLSLVARIGGQEAEISVSDSNRTIDVAAPRAGEVGTYTADVTVEGIDGRVARLRNGFRYIEEGVVFSVNPTTGQQGTRITLSGRNLLGGGSNISTARIGDRNELETNAIVTNSSDSFVVIEITNNLPAGSTYPLLSDITLVADTGATVISLRQFTLVQPGQIASVSPAQGQFGTRVTISGSDLLQGGSREDIFSITLSGIEILEILDTPSPPSNTQIIVRANTSSAGDPGEVIITLMTGARIVSPGSVTFEYLSPGRIGTVVPNIGTVGTNVIISGANLLGGGGSLVEVILGGTRANILGTPSNTRIEVRAADPSGGNANGTVEIVIDTGAIISGGGWTFEDLGIITSISPTVGQQGVAVTAAGRSLLGSSASSLTNCTLAGIEGTVTQSENDEVICRAGLNPFAGINPDNTRLSGPLVLTANSGPVITSTDIFSYYIAYIGMIEPNNGTNGTYVTITGKNLIYDDLNVASVTFGGISTLLGTTRVLTDDSIRVRVGVSPAASSNNRVRLQLTNEALFVLENAWEYTEPGVITSISPQAALPGEEVYIYGTNLVPAHVEEVMVVVGQTRSYEAIVNSSSVMFRPGPTQDGIDEDTFLDIPNFDLPIQIIASNGATVYSQSVVFQYLISTSRVDAIVPTAGVGGTEVNVMGVNLLNGSSSAVRVTLAGRNATILSATDSLVRVIAGEGPNEGSRGRVIIEGANGRVSGIGRDIWEYFPEITAADVDPRMGQNRTRVSIDLKGISLTPSEVSLAGIRATIVDCEGTLCVAAGPSQATSIGDIRIEFDEESAVLTIPSAWQYLNPTNVIGFTPEQGYYNTNVTIQGTNFQVGGRVVESVQLAGLNTELISQSDTEIVVRVSELRNSSTSAIVGPVTIYSVDGATYWSSMEFTYVQLRVDEVTPQSGQGGSVVTITGVGLLAGSSLSFLQFQLGGIDVQSNLNITNTEIQVVAAPYPAQTNESDITYTVADGGTVTIPDSWSYVQPGQITSVDPSYGVQGSYVTIRGQNMLQGGKTVANVMIAGIPVMEIVVGISDFIYVRLGLSPTTLPRGPVNIESDTGASLESDIEFVYNASGRVSIISLSEGQNGTKVTINGMGFGTFGAVSRVTLAGIEATLVGEVTDTSITVEAGRPDIFEEFNGEVIVETVTGTIITGNPVFRYRQEGIIYRAYPAQGQMQTRVVISGESLFGGGSSLETVYLAGIKAEINENESNETFVSVTAAASERAPLVGDIVLISDTGAYVRKTDSWSYVQPGNITSIEPPVGQFGTRIRIRGTGLLSGGDSISSVLIGDIVSYDVLSSSDIEVVARVGRPNTTENFTETVTLVSNFGGELASSFSWTYLNSSEVTSVSPMIGVGGDEVTVNGTNLLGGGTAISRVTTAGIEAIDADGSDDQVVFKVGPEPNGAAIQGDIVIESDTGALTIVEDGWSYNRTCPEGAFGTVVDNCTSCNEECTACIGPTDEDCLTCANFIIPLSESSMRCVNRCPNVSTLANVCVDLCESNQFRRVNTIVNATFCHDCHPLCDAQLGCTGPNATQCNGCEVALDVNTQACVSVCPNGTWQNEMKECIPCDDQCLSSAGCFGNTNADCYECRNVRAPSTLLENESTNNSERYICLERCPPDSYEDSGDCFPCDSECEGGCTGPTPFDCNRCASVSRIQASDTLCISSCNADLSVNSLYQYSDGSCQACSDLCSLVDGCTGPTDSDCITCRTNASTNATLPRINGTCVLVCPNTSASVSPRPSQFYYHNTVTGSCELCDSSCTNGCRGSSADDCIESDEESNSPFAAGVATIGITASIIVILAILCAVLFLMSLWCWVKNSRHNKYKLTSSAEATEPANEMVYRYTRPDLKESTPTQIQETVSVGLEAEYYTPMSPTTPLAPQLKSQSPQHGPIVKVEEKYKDVRRSTAIDSGATLIENVEAALYTEAVPEVPQIPARPAKPVQEKPTGMQKSSLDRRGQPPGKQVKKPAAAPPPEPEGEMYTEMRVQPPEGEFYTEMNASVQEVYVNPSGNTQDEEYSEMSPLHIIQEQVYDDTAGPTDNLLSPQSKGDEKTEALYEDTDVTITSPSYQKIKHSNSAQPLPSSRAPDMPVPQKRRSVPLPQTPLEVSIQGRQPQPLIEEVYEFAESSLPEESLYEAIPTTQAGRPLPAEPSPQLPPKGLRTSGRYPPIIPPREKQ